MLFQWLKRYMPHSLYGRAALILLVPIVTIQLVVTVAFIQRHFSNITDQMTGIVGRELAYLVSQIDNAPSAQEAAERLQDLAPVLLMRAELPGNLALTERKRWDDFTGARVIRNLHRLLPGLTTVDLARQQGQVFLAIDTRYGPLQVAFGRERLSAQNPHQLLVLMVSIGVVMTLISYFFLRNQLRPIRNLGRAARAFGEGRVIPYRVSGATEVRAAGQAFLDMRSRIERQAEQRRLMLSGVSHDLRTPLTRFKLGLSMMPDSPERTALERDVADMERLVDAFLHFARSEAEVADGAASGTRMLRPGTLLREVAENARRAGQEVAIGPIAPTGPVRLEPLALVRALENLLSNAARHASRARISLEAGADHIGLVVEDDGPGIPPEARAEALKPFARLDRARNQDKGSGVGLGLAIAADIARAHGGRLILGESTALGGLRAELRLPRRG